MQHVNATDPSQFLDRISFNLLICSFNLFVFSLSSLKPHFLCKKLIWILTEIMRLKPSHHLLCELSRKSKTKNFLPNSMDNLWDNFRLLEFSFKYKRIRNSTIVFSVNGCEVFWVFTYFVLFFGLVIETNVWE